MRGIAARDHVEPVPTMRGIRTAELVRAIQEAEERVWELDAERIDFEAMSEEELERCIARGRRAR